MVSEMLDYYIKPAIDGYAALPVRPVIVNMMLDIEAEFFESVG